MILEIKVPEGENCSALISFFPKFISYY
ncbi:hypothetical protein ACM55G_13150 [Flavobacterium sp. LB3P122]